ncbi:hypothetical protein [Pseudonocardia sp. NPDC049635]|uniref:hypothetical protein n=1 Tax=Pseudonocardia sp. NPDC049635 TaxID=3155506 RepID=UPI0033F648F1
MTTGEERSALDDLRSLLASDLSGVEPDALYAGIRASELVFDSAQQWTGRLVAELRRREIPWSQIEAATEVPKSTLDRRAGRIE